MLLYATMKLNYFFFRNWLRDVLPFFVYWNVLQHHPLLVHTNILNRISKLNSVSPVRRAFFYIFSSFTSSLPWASCDNPWNTEACRRFDSKNCTELGGIMTNQQECVFQKDVTIDVWKNISETARNAKMPSDEFFQ